MRIANILFHTLGRMELSLAQSQRGKLREFSDLGHNPKQFRICLTPSNSKNVVHIYFFSGIHHTAPSACRPGTRLGFLGSILPFLVLSHLHHHQYHHIYTKLFS